MTVQFASVHTTREGDTLDRLVEQYRLSSRRAIVDIESNASIRDRLQGEGALPPGLVVHIPPNAVDLVRDRLYRLHEIRPVLLSHFDTMRDVAESDLRPALLGSSAAEESRDAFEVIQVLAEFVAESVSTIAANTRSLAEIGAAMSLTHAATDMDRAAASALSDPRCGLYWTVTPPVLGQWETMWDEGLWQARWSGVDADDAWTSTLQYQTTIRSIVVQQVDARLRESQALERRLRAE